jgi:iron(III) transport system ATP-binding protein
LDVARFVGEAVVLPGRADAGTVSCALGEIPLIDGAVHGAVDTMIRPEQIRLRAPEREAAIVGQVTARAFYGPDSVVQVQLDGVPTPVTARVLGHDVPGPGARVELSVIGAVMAYPHPAASGDPGGSSARAALLSGPALR